MCDRSHAEIAGSPVAEIAGSSVAEIAGSPVAEIAGSPVAEIAGSPVAWMFVCCKSCVLSGRGLCVGISLVQRSPTEWGVYVCLSVCQ